MNAIVTRAEGKGLRRNEAAALPGLLEFHSPSAALAVAPVQYGARGINMVVCSLAAACFAAMALIPVDKVVVAQGKVVAQTATSVVQPLETAIVRSVDVREGQVVKKGELLARLDPTFATADAGALTAQVESLSAEVGRLQAEASGTDFRPTSTSPAALLQRAIFTQRAAERGFKMENYAQKISSLQAQIQRSMSDVNSYTDRLKIAVELEGKRVELERAGVGSIINRMAATDSKLEVERGLNTARAQALQGARDLSAMQAERDAYDQNWRSQVIQELTEQSRKLSDARENLAKADRRRQLVELRADQDSIVLNIAKVSSGSVLQSGEQLMSLTPVDAPLEVEANVPGTESGFVHAGNPVTIKLDSFPPSQYGDLAGTVRFVSPDSFVGDPDQRQRGVQQMPQTGQAFYRMRVTIDESKLHDTPPGFRLVPGMPVTADVKVGKRTVMSYLLSRVMPVAMDGMREP
jgi:hemolysin D